MKVKSEVAQLCLTLCDPMDCSLPGSSLHGILQARILEWVAISFSRGSSQLRDRTQVSCIAGRRFNLWATGEVLENHSLIQMWCIIHNFDTHKLHVKQQRIKGSMKIQRNILSHFSGSLENERKEEDPPSYIPSSKWITQMKFLACLDDPVVSNLE